MSDFMSVTEVAQRLGLGVNSVRCQLRANPGAAGFPVTIIGRRVLVPRKGFENWIKGKQS